MRLADLYRGTDVRRGSGSGLTRSTSADMEMREIDGPQICPRAPGLHTVQIRTGRRKFGQIGRVPGFRSVNGWYTRPVFSDPIAEETDF